MASTEPFAAKQLGELLQDQQEPFTLEVYLLERGYLKNKSNSERRFRCCSSNSSKFLKRSASCGINKGRKVIPNCSKIVRFVFDKLVSINLRIKNGRDQGIGVAKIRKSQETEEEDKFSSASSTTIFNSCSMSDTEELYVSSEESHISATKDTFQHRNHLSEGEVATDRKIPRGCMENKKQLSPDSVLEEIQSGETSPVHNTQPNVQAKQEEPSTISKIITTKKATSDSISSVSLGKLLDEPSTEQQSHTGTAELQEIFSSDPSQYIKTKMALQQTKQLLFDCVKEVVETHRWNNRRRKRFQEFLGPEELGELLCNNIWAWSKQSTMGTDSTQLLNLDLLSSAEEWSDFKQQKREIAMEIGDVILEDISNEIAAEMVHKHNPGQVGGILQNTRSVSRILSKYRGSK